jgi:hydrogenase maturation factor
MICRALSLDPLKLIASGALLIAVAPGGADAVVAAIQAAGIPVTAIGEVRPSGEGLTIVTSGMVEALTPPARDEIARALDGTQ